MNKVIHHSKDHIYYYGDEKYESVSGVFKGVVKPDEDWDYNAGRSYFKSSFPELYQAVKKEKDMSFDHPQLIERLLERSKVPMSVYIRERDELRRQWKENADEATERGTAFHTKMEKEDYERGYRINPATGKKVNVFRYEKQFDNEAICENLFDLEDGYYPELLVFNHEYKVAGQLDMGFIRTEGKDRIVDIDDWKGLSLGTLIPTPDKGFVKIEDLKTGDKLYNGSGQITKLNGVSNIHQNPCYKILFDTNDEIVADHEHKWVVSTVKSKQVDGKKIYYKEESVMTTEQMFNCKEKLSIKCSFIEGEEKDLPIDPYVLGLWLADGNSHFPRITCNREDIWEELKRRGCNLGVNLNESFDKCEERTLLGIAKYLNELNVIKNKHIPDIYMQSSYKQRLDLLRGYMDGDGHFNRKRRRCVMDTTSENQAIEVASLCSSLGFKPTIITSNHKGFGKIVKVWGVNFTPIENPFLVRNKDYKEVIGGDIGKYSKVRQIKSIEKVDTVPTICLSVSGEDKTYLFSKNYIKTHNTDANILMKPNFRHPKKGYERLKFPLGHLYHTNHNVYMTKIGMYAWMLEKFGFKVGNLYFTSVDINPETLELNSEPVRYSLPYKQWEISQIFNLYKK